MAVTQRSLASSSLLGAKDAALARGIAREVTGRQIWRTRPAPPIISLFLALTRLPVSHSSSQQHQAAPRQPPPDDAHLRKVCLSARSHGATSIVLAHWSSFNDGGDRRLSSSFRLCCAPLGLNNGRVPFSASPTKESRARLGSRVWSRAPLPPSVWDNLPASSGHRLGGEKTN